MVNLRVRLRPACPAILIVLALAGCPRNRPPDAPATPSGPQAGLVDSTYTFSTLTTDPDGDSVSYRFAWGDGDTSDWSALRASGDSLAASHAWDSAGTYFIRAQAQELLGNLPPWSDALSVAISLAPNTPPDIPGLRGPESVRKRIETTFKVWCSDPEYDLVQVRVAWGDGDTSDWSEPAEPGPDVLLDHEWQTHGQYTLRAQARDSAGGLSGWSAGLAVSVVTVPYPYRRIATFALSPSPDGMAFTPDGRYLYVAMSDSSVAVLRTADYAEVARVRVGKTPFGVVMLPNGEYLYVANYEGWSVSVIRTADNAVVATISDLHGPIDLVALPDGKRVYVSCDMDSTVAVISTETHQVIRRVPVGLIWDPGQIAASPDGQYVYVASRWWIPHHFAVIRTVDDSVVARVEYGEHSINDLLVTSGGNYLYATRSYSDFVIFRLPELTVEKEIEGYDEIGPCAMTMLPNGQYVFASAVGERRALVVRADDHTVVDTVAVADISYCIAVAPDGEHVYLSHCSEDSVTVLGY